MTLRTVRVPPEVEPLFARAEQVVSAFFANRIDEPSRGSIEIVGERYLLVRAASLSVEFFDLVRGLYGAGRETEADEFARNILFDLAHAIGRSDARNFHARMGLVDPIAKLSAGPVHFAHAGWAFVDISPRSNPVATQDFALYYDHPYSFESDAWRGAGRDATFPVCIMNSGYSSGWCTESFGVSLVATEGLCRARGDQTCRFVMAPLDRIEALVKDEFGEALRTSGRSAPPIPDFFARKRLEDELRRKFAEELHEREVAEARLREAQKLEAVGRLAGGVAHDFNNLMTVVIARATRVARKLDPDDPLRRELDGIVEAGERASALTNQLLVFSRARIVALEPVDFDAAIADVVRVLSEPEEPSPITFTRGAEGAVVSVNRSQLEQIVLNLVVNAREAMPGGGPVTLATDVVTAGAGGAGEPPGSKVRLRVRDQGVGMDEATRARVFEPYFTTKPGHGTGLGLATVYGIVQQARGDVTVESEVGKGTEFTVTLPVATTRTSRDTNHEAPVQASRRSLRLMLVEDHPDVRTILETGLRDLGHDVRTFSEGNSAVAIDDAALAGLHALVTDVAMPGRSGFEVASELRARRPDLPVLFITGYAAEPSMLERIEGARILMKPFQLGQLMAALNGLVPPS